MDAAGSPVIRVSNCQHSPHSVSRSTSAMPLIDLPMQEIRRRSPTPSPRSTPNPSPRSSPRIPEATLSLPPTSPRPNSRASSVTLKDSPVSQDTHTVLGGVLVAEPSSIVTSPTEESTSPGDDTHKSVWLAEAPVEFFTAWRYNTREKMTRSQDKQYGTIPTRNAIPPRGNAGRWEPYVHPEGSLYFRYQNFYTNVYLYDGTNLHYTDKAVDKLCERMGQHHVRLEDTEVGIQYHVDDEGDHVGCYYLCDLTTKEVFWLNDCPEGFVNSWYPNIVVMGREHLSHALQSQFWDHVYMFPHGRHLSQDTLRTMHGDICYFLFDRRTSATTTAPFSDEDLHQFLQISKELVKTFLDGQTTLAPHVVTTARFNSFLLIERFIRYHGERHAQLECDKSVLEETQENPSWWFTCATWLFFFAPRTNIERLRKVWVDRMVNQTVWAKMIEELQEDLADSITPSTVILTANVGFLAIQSVDQGSGLQGIDRTAGQIISYISTLLSLGNIFASTILARKHKPSRYRRPEDAAQYLSARTQSSYGLEKLAVVMSIPTACFLWALLTFFMAICWVCFYNTSVTTRISIGIALLIVGMLLGSVVYNESWEPSVVFDSGVLRERMERTKSLVKKAKRMPRSVGTKLKKTLSGSLSPRRFTGTFQRTKKARKSTGATSNSSGLAGMRTSLESVSLQGDEKHEPISIVRNPLESGDSRTSLPGRITLRFQDRNPVHTGSLESDRVRRSIENPRRHISIESATPPQSYGDHMYQPHGSISRPRLYGSGGTRDSLESGSTAVTSSMTRSSVEDMV